MESMFFSNVSNVNTLKQPSGMRRPSNIPAYVPPQVARPISQVSKSQVTESDHNVIKGDQFFWKLEILCGSASATSKFVDGCIKGTFVSDYVFSLSQKTLSPSKIEILEKGFRDFSNTFNQ